MKNTKTVLGIIAFIATFFFSAVLVQMLFPAPLVSKAFVEPQYRSETALQIEDFINTDKRNGMIRDRKFSSQTYSELKTDSENYSKFYANAMTDYWKASSRLNAKEFPRDFQIAWQKHMQAWEDYTEFLADTNENQDRNVMSEEEFKAIDYRYNAEINRTWQKVLRIGRSYGADVW